MKSKILLSLALLTFLLSCQRSAMQSVNKSVNPKEAVQSETSRDAELDGNSNLPQTATFDYLAHLEPEHREVLQRWLRTKSYLRPAVEKIDNSIFQEKYKDSFKENIKFLRETVGENGYQYYCVGDMNHDGKADFAILLVDTRKQSDEIDHFALAIFNAPFSKVLPAYYEENLQGITNSYITFDRDSEKYLYLGKFESDVYCATYYPKKKSYYFKDCLDE